MVLVEVVLIRHAQSGNNLLWDQTGDSVGRHPDTHLTALGEQQAAALAHWFAHHDGGPRLTELHTSLMFRAVQTAAPLAEALDLPLHGHGELFEVGGPYEEDTDTRKRTWHPGSTLPELRQLSNRLHHVAAHPEERWWSGPYEEDHQAADRARRVIDGIRAGGDDGPRERTIGLVTHGFFSQYLLRALLGIPDMTGWVQIDNTSISRFRIDDAGVLAVSINATPHLSPHQVTT